MSEAAVVITARAGGGCALAGELTFATVPQLWRDLARGGWLVSAPVADLAAVTDADSAGLALLLAWRARRLGAGGDVGFVSLPRRLLALAKLTGAETMLAQTQSPGVAAAGGAAGASTGSASVSSS